jgi:uncharacterized protein
MAFDVRGRTALVTGASSGIGAAIARDLASRGANLVLVARRADRLEHLASELRAKGVIATVAPTDLLVASDREGLAASFPDIDILVNNAGLGVFGHFTQRDWPPVARMIELNITALTHLTHLYAKLMTARGAGRIMLVASTAAFQPTPIFTAYAATKAYVLSFGEALNAEVKRFGVRITVLCPGVTESEFFDVANQKKSAFVTRSMMDANIVARTGVDALIAGRSSVVAGLANAVLAFSTRLSPRPLAAAIGYRLMRM